jgi:hypothetical protein
MKYYYLKPDKTQVGLLSTDELKKCNISKETMVWAEGFANWVTAFEVDDLKQLFKTPPPPPVSVTNNPQKQTSENVINLAEPPNLKSFNWGALMLNWIWSIGNNTWIGLLVLLPLLANFIPTTNNSVQLFNIVSLVMSIALGMYGNRWAWKNKKWKSVEHFQKTQKSWNKAAFALFIIGLIIGVATVVIEYAAKNNINSNNTEKTENNSTANSNNQNVSKTITIDYTIPKETVYYKENLQNDHSIGKIYPIGWSKDSKFAYINFEYSDGSDESMFEYQLIIQNVVTDKIEKKLTFKTGTLNKVWQKNYSQIKNVLNSYNIEQQINLSLFNSLQYKNDTYKLKTEFGKNGKYFSKVKMMLSNTKGKTKIISTVTCRKNTSNYAAFFFLSPFDSRILVFYSDYCTVSGMSAYSIEYQLTGCSLEQGFN